MAQLFESGRLPGILFQLNLAAILLLLILGAYFLFHLGNQKVAEKNRLRMGLEEIKLGLVILVAFLLLGWIGMQRALLFPLLTPFLIAGVLSYALNPFLLFLKGKGLSRTLSVAGIFLVFFLSLFALSFSLFPLLGEEIARFGEMLPELSKEWMARISSWYDRHLSDLPLIPESFSGLLDFFDFELKSVTEWLLQSSGSLFEGISILVSSLVSLVTIPVLTFYFLKDGEKIFTMTKNAVPLRSRSWVFPLGKDVDSVLGGFIRGQLLVALFVGVLSGLTLLLLGIDFWIILGILAGITNIIPYVGPLIGAVPAVLVALATSPGKTLWVVLAFVAIQQVESSMISPKVVGNRVGLHPTLIIFSLLVGGALGGLVGLILAVPIAAVVKVLLKALFDWLGQRYPHIYEEKKDPPSTEDS